MSRIDMRWKPTPRNGWPWHEAKCLAARIGGDEAYETEVRMGEDGFLHMEVQTSNMVVRYMECQPASFMREILTGVNREQLVQGPEFTVVRR